MQMQSPIYEYPTLSEDSLSLARSNPSLDRKTIHNLKLSLIIALDETAVRQVQTSPDWAAMLPALPR